MAERTSGLHRIVTVPALYATIQSLLGGGPAGRAKVAARLFGDVSGQSVLEIGCGPGTWVPYLDAAASYTGIDWNARHIETAQRLYASGTRRFVCGDLSEMLQDGAAQVDLVVGVGILHHLDDPVAVQVLSTVSALLRPGGSYVGIEPVLHAGQHPVARLLKALDSGRNIRTDAGYRSLLAPHFASLRTDVETGLMRVPYSHCLIAASAA